MKQAIFLTSESPIPPSGGGKLRDYGLIQMLLENMEVEVLCFAKADTTESYVIPPLPQGLTLTLIQHNASPIWKRALSPLRPYVVNGYSQEMAQAIKMRAKPGTLLWVSRLGMAQYIPLAKSLGYRVILDEHNIESDVLFDSAFSSIENWPQSFIALQCAYYEKNSALRLMQSLQPQT